MEIGFLGGKGGDTKLEPLLRPNHSQSSSIGVPLSQSSGTNLSNISLQEAPLESYSSLPSTASLVSGLPPLERKNSLLQEQEPAPERKDHFCKTWGERIVFLAGLGSSLALLLADSSHWSRATGAMLGGLCIQALISSQFSDLVLARIRQVSMTAFGQMTIFCLIQIFLNATDPKTKTACALLGIAMGGANIQIMARWLYQHGRIHTNAVSLQAEIEDGEKFQKSKWLSPKIVHSIKIGASVACLITYLALDESLSKGLLAFGSSFFSSQVLGERFLMGINAKIKQYNIVNPKWAKYLRYTETALIISGYLAIPLSFIRYNQNPSQDQLLVALILTGISIGFFDGIMHESEMSRLRNLPVAELDEFEDLNIKRDLNSPPPKWVKVARITAKVSVPVYGIGSLLALFAWKEAKLLNDTKSRISLFSLLGGYSTSLAMGYATDLTWDSKVRKYWKDRLMTLFFVSPRIFGINLLWLYLSGSSTLQMGGNTIQTGDKSLDNALISLFWGTLGAAMGRENYIASSDRKGNPLIKWPLIAILNTATMSRHYLSWSTSNESE